LEAGSVVSKCPVARNPELFGICRSIKYRPECAGRPARSRWCKSITMKE